jgi:hypothetical protein
MRPLLHEFWFWLNEIAKRDLRLAQPYTVSHPRDGARRRGDPRLISGSFVLLNKGVAT